jgi:hypothetical protein
MGSSKLLWKSLNSALSETPNPSTYATKIGSTDYVGDLNKCATFYRRRL